MKEITIVLKNKSGLHARPASQFVSAASKFKSTVFMELNGKKANAKSILGVLSIGATSGSAIKILTEGQDEDIASQELAKILENLGD